MCTPKFILPNSKRKLILLFRSIGIVGPEPGGNIKRF